MRSLRPGVLEVCALLAAALLLGAAGGLGRPDLVINDWITAHDRRAAPDDVVVVAIDDRSLALIGRWPWPRSVHAALLERLREAAPRAVALDLIFSEPDAQRPDDDAALALAIERCGKVVLPMRMETVAGPGAPVAVLPIEPLARAARASGGGIGHIHIELDHDGVVRSVFLREGMDGQWWNHLAPEMLAAAGTPLASERWPGRRRPAGEAPDGALWWSRDYAMLIPFAGPPGQVRRVSYVDVLEGRVPAAELRDKFVFVGATAAGMGDAYPTPAASQDGLMPGVEISANVLDALRRGRVLEAARPWQNALFTVLPLLLALAALRRWQPRSALVAIGALALAILAATFAARHALGLQFAPAAALLCLATVYPLWSWRQLESALGYLAGEVQRIGAEQGVRLDDGRRVLRARGDLLDRRIAALRDATGQLRALQRFVRQSLDSLPDPVLVCAADGAVLLANRAAATTFGTAADALRGHALDALLAREVSAADGGALPRFGPAPDGASGHGPAQVAATDGAVADGAAHERGGDADSAGTQTNPKPGTDTSMRRPDPAAGVYELPVVDAHERDGLLKAVPRHDDDGRFVGWIVSLVDVSLLVEAQRQREEALRFISHDMRAPQASILTLVELERERAATPAQRNVLDRIAAHAQRTLAFADAFVDLARAQSSRLALAPVNLGDVLLDAAEQFWDRAGARVIEIVTELPETPCWSVADRGLLTRALGNLIDNAIKYGPANARVRCSLRRRDDAWEFAVRDAGPGIPERDLARLFEQFGRLDHDADGSPRPEGFGLGLAFVRAVMARHRGRVEVHGASGAGTEFRLVLPLADAPVDDVTVAD